MVTENFKISQPFLSFQSVWLIMSPQNSPIRKDKKIKSIQLTAIKIITLLCASRYFLHLEAEQKLNIQLKMLKLLTHSWLFWTWSPSVKP